jgi:hypothetical protein
VPFGFGLLAMAVSSVGAVAYKTRVYLFLCPGWSPETGTGTGTRAAGGRGVLVTRS